MTAAAIGSSIDVAAERQAVIAEARSWVGTGFHHAARIKGVGVDCAQLLLAVYSAVGVVHAGEIEPYPPDWFLHESERRFERWLDVYGVRTEHPGPGDVALFTYGRSPSHGGILTRVGDNAHVVHAYRGLGVTEQECWPGSALGSRLASTWTFARWG